MIVYYTTYIAHNLIQLTHPYSITLYITFVFYYYYFLCKYVFEAFFGPYPDETDKRLCVFKDQNVRL